MFKLIFICPDKFNNSYSLPSFGNLIKLNEIISASKQSCNIKKVLLFLLVNFVIALEKVFLITFYHLIILIIGSFI